MKNLLPALAGVLLWSCTSSTSSNPAASVDSSGVKTESKGEAKTSDTAMANKPKADAATIMARPQVPILCYHHIRELKTSAQASSGYEVTPAAFRAQMKMLHDSGYHTVLPDQLYNYLVYGATLPEKSVMITYDDTDEEQFSIGKTEMDKYSFKGVYFIMTISIGRPHYMSKEQIRQLSDEGHAIASHTWRHDRVDKYLTTPHIDRDTKKKWLPTIGICSW